VVKKTPESSHVLASSPYFSWTTKAKPRIEIFPLNMEYILWKRYFTKKDYEDESSSPEGYYLGSVQILNQTVGSNGYVAVYNSSHEGDNDDKSLLYRWNFTIISKWMDDDEFENVGFFVMFFLQFLNQVMSWNKM